MALKRCLAVLVLVLALLALLALARPLDHDESQYVAAATLTAHGLLPYRDFAYLQTPLQPFAFAPIAWAAGVWTWPALRLVNALLGAVAVGFVWRAAREAGVGEAGAGQTRALIVAALFAGCDILLFSVGTARNDALPVALFAAALPLIVRVETGRVGWERGAAVLIGVLLAAAAAAKISYALPAAAYGIHALLARRQAVWVMLGGVPVVAFVAWTWWVAPEAFWFGTVTFPARAPAEFYAARPWKLSLAAKAIDTPKFLALGAALPALAWVARDAWARRRLGTLDWLILAGLVAALLPYPTWRQYLLPVLPALFVRLSLCAWPTRGWRVAIAVFAGAGLAPSLVALASATRGVPMAAAMREGAAIRRALDQNRVAGPVATLSPQFLPATGRLPDPDFATGPFYFRSRALLDGAAERRLRVVSRVRPRAGTDAILVGGEGGWTSGDARLDDTLARWAVARSWRAVPVAGTHFRLFVRPPAVARSTVRRYRLAARAPLAQDGTR